ncbi:MAG: 30S ribosomal protein S16 [Thermoplasmata archaeon]
MLRIRLSRKGSNQKPFYRIVVSDSQRTPRARVVETIGQYNPGVNPAKVEIDLARAEHWVGKGAHPSETVRSLLARLKKKAAAAS